MENLEIFEKIVENAIELYISHDERGLIIAANSNAREELGYENGMKGVSLSDLFPDNISISETGLSSELVYDGAVREMMVYRRNYTCFRASVKCTQIGSSEVPYIIMISNISDKHSLEKIVGQVKQEAEEAAKVKSEFVANITHELRTPVNGILGNTRILLDEVTDPAQLKILNTIEHGCNEMNNLINNILDFSKLEAGKFTIENRKFNFREMIEYVRTTHQPKITEKGLKFFVTISPEVPEYIIGDELRIGQVLNNLLSNACKFTHFGRISVEILKTAQNKNRMELFFMVVDTGIGMDQAGLDKLFKSFSQVDASISRKYGGTGLGLNISKQLVTLMGGNITVESELNRGTMFTFSIWVEIPEEDLQNSYGKVDSYNPRSLQDTLSMDGEQVNVAEFGSEQNIQELKNQLSKIILCIEMDNWEKAENFAESIKQLTAESPKDIKTAALRLKMAIQKADYDKAVAAHGALEEQL